MANVLLNKYEKACSIIDNAISVMEKTDEIVNNSDYPDGKKKIEVLKKNSVEKRKEKFTISICGMVNAGKSTFINSFLFGKRVLPAFDTPWSAKLTFIEYTDKKPYFEAVFYSKEEFASLEANYKELKQSKDFENLKAKAFQRGISEKDYIKENSHTITRYNLDELEEFVTDLKNDQAKNAKYTPYVKEVHLYANNKKIENIRIVDTPGLHDSNIINSQETLKWICNTHALIFVLPPKGCTLGDIEFFKEYQAMKGPDGRIFVLNKCDGGTPEDAESVRNNLYKLGCEQEFKDIDVFGQNEIICRYSALAKLLQCMKRNNIPFDEKYEDEWYYNRIGRVDADPDNVAEKISEHLYKNGGHIKILSCVRDISQVYFNCQKTLENALMESKGNLDDIDKSADRLNDELENLKRFKKEIQKKYSNMHVTARSKADERGKLLRQKLDNTKKKLNINVSGMSYSDLKILPSELRLRIQEKLDPDTGEIGLEIKSFDEQMLDIIHEVIEQAESTYKDNKIDAPIIEQYFNLENLEDWNSELDNVVNAFKNDLDEVLPWNWFTQLFTPDKAMQANASDVIKNTVANLGAFVSMQIHKIVEKMEKYVKLELKNIVDTSEKSIENKQNILEKQKLDKVNEKQKLLQTIEKQKSNVVTIKRRLRNFKNSIKSL